MAHHECVLFRSLREFLHFVIRCLPPSASQNWMTARSVVKVFVLRLARQVLERGKLMNELLKNIFGGGIVAFAVASVATRILFVAGVASVAGVAIVASVATRVLLVLRAYIRCERVVVEVVVEVVERGDHLW